MSAGILHLLAEALLHSIWQGAMVAGLLFAVLRLVPAGHSQLRYGAGFLALVLPGWFDTKKTDAEGRFVFTNLPKGNFKVNTRSGKGGEAIAESGSGGEVLIEAELYEWFDGRLGE